MMRPIVKPPPLLKPVPHVAPIPVAHPTLQAKMPHVYSATPLKRMSPPPPMHFNLAQADAGLNLGLGIAGGNANGHGSIGGFEDDVRQRIEAQKTYPPGIKHLPDECVVSYRVTVDHSGNLVDYRLYGCFNPFLNAASRAAILLASPFPVPPDFGGNTYEVYGSLIYTHR